MSDYATYSLDISEHMSTAVPLPMQHLGIDKEYREVLSGISQDQKQLNDALMIKKRMFCPCCICCIPDMIQKQQEAARKFMESVGARCDKANASANLAGRAQFIPRTETYMRGKHQMDKFLLTIEYKKQAGTGSAEPYGDVPAKGSEMPPQQSMK
eukprot:TRINITY_DN35041_c0_g1_i1.p1 TRINITY_DN35041_c0_g1~~TRINITY_DN35041_c0_g1_i1.p1  ORF type:complete len:155 (+),score=16.20 TRINITY_DN35041_c0_g1_i1:61-525(+)